MAARYHKLFQRYPVLLQEMLQLYKEGWSSVALGKKYQCDHTSILYQVHKSGILPKRRTRIFIPEKKEVLYYPLKATCTPKPADKFDYLFEEPINPGKNYKEYVTEREQRHAHHP